MKKSGAPGHSAKHAGTHKHVHHKTAKHNPKAQPKKAAGHHAGGKQPVHTVAKHPHHPKPRKLSFGEVACCPAEAVAMAARLAGWAVTPEDVLDLYARCADGPDSGFTIAAALTAGSPFGIADFDYVNPEEVMPVDRCSRMQSEYDLHSGPEPLVTARAGLILGVDLPGPHAVTVAPDGTWWSWGEPFDPSGWPDLVVEEAWAVTWR